MPPTFFALGISLFSMFATFIAPTALISIADAVHSIAFTWYSRASLVSLNFPHSRASLF